MSEIHVKFHGDWIFDRGLLISLQNHCFTKSSLQEKSYFHANTRVSALNKQTKLFFFSIHQLKP